MHAGPTAGSANCSSGGTEVIASKNFWKVEETEENSSRRNAASATKVFKLYRCDPGLCNGNNTCNKGHVGVVCGRCPDDHALEAGMCVKCNMARDPEALAMWRAVFGVVAGLLVSLVWFLFAWAPLFGGTAQSFFMAWFAWCVKDVVIPRCFL